jgi:hypothetical protein
MRRRLELAENFPGGSLLLVELLSIGAQGRGDPQQLFDIGHSPLTLMCSGA